VPNEPLLQLTSPLENAGCILEAPGTLIAATP
jgi:hypothetical protein